jgi:hypothetical protein
MFFLAIACFAIANETGRYRNVCSHSSAICDCAIRPQQCEQQCAHTRAGHRLSIACVRFWQFWRFSLFASRAEPPPDDALHACPADFYSRKKISIFL